MFRKIVLWLLAPFGYDCKGNVQWFYTLTIFIHCLLTWLILPEIALVFSILWGVHVASIYLTSYMQNHSINISEHGIWSRFLILNIILLVVALLVCWWWILITIVISCLAYIKAPVNQFNLTATRGISISSFLLYVSFLILVFVQPIALIWKLSILFFIIVYCNFNEKVAGRGYCINYLVEDLICVLSVMKIKKEVKSFFEGKNK